MMASIAANYLLGLCIWQARDAGLWVRRALLIATMAVDLGILFSYYVDECIDNETIELAKARLAETNTDYRNLVNEYRDGILLFEISNRNVWERSSVDVEAQNSFFRQNRTAYSWDVPHFKGYVISAMSDSVASEIQGFLAKNPINKDMLSVWCGC